MKQFRYPKGHSAGQTMTVAELREFLSQYPDDMPVIAQWEGTWNWFDPRMTCVDRIAHVHQDDQCDCLVFDVNN